MYETTDTHETRVNEQLVDNMTDLIINLEVQHIINIIMMKVLTDYQVTNLRL